MKRFTILFFLIFGNTLFAQNEVNNSVNTYLLSDLLSDSIVSFNEFNELFVHGELIYLKDYYGLEGHPSDNILKAEYLRLNKDTFYVINYDSLKHIISCGKVIAINPLSKREVISIQYLEPPYPYFNRGTGFEYDYKIGQWQELEDAKDKIWVGNYRNGIKDGLWILCGYNGSEIDINTVYKTIIY